MNLFILLVFAGALLSVTVASVTRQIKRNIICYYINGYGLKIAPPESLDTSLCTHINYAFVRLDNNGSLTYQKKYVDIKKRMYERTLSLKKSNDGLKVLISVGDTNASIFSSVAADPLKRESFVNSSVNYLKTHGFDGIDIDWEKPYLDDEDNFISLLKELKQALQKENWILSVAVYPNPSEGYKVREIVKYVDMINIMCYNYYGSWSAYTGQNAALFSSPIESVYEKTHLNTAVSLQNWIDAGATRDKINVGVPFFGRTFTLLKSDDHKLHSPITGGGVPATPSYKQICLNFTNYTPVWDEDQKVFYKYYQDQWLSYDEERSIAAKAKYIRSQFVAGAMVWQIGQDDVNGECGTKQVLLKTLNRYLNEDRNV